MRKRIVLAGLLTGSLALAVACKGGGSVVSDAGSKPATAPATTTMTTPAASPATANAAPKPSPTLDPMIKKAQERPGQVVSVPENLKRPMTQEEMQKAMQALPPEVRQRIMGMQQAPAPQPTKK